MPKILFTGGHHNSTLVIAKKCQETGYDVIWIGHKFNPGDQKSISAEYLEVTSAGIKFLEITTGKFYKRLNLLEALKIILGFLQSFFYLVREKPSLVFSSGGYISVPVVISAWLLRIKSITHEQTVVAGWANKAIAPFVNKILITYSSSIKNYPAGKTFPVGLPVSKELLSAEKTNVDQHEPKTIYITCGKQGSHKINTVIFKLIPQLVKKYKVIHQTGSNLVTKDLEKARRLKERLSVYSNNYQFSSYFVGSQSIKHLKTADLVISRSGAHTIYELLLLSKRAILIPISWVSHNEQLLNAKLAQKQIGSEIIEEKDLSPEVLLNSIEKTIRKKIKINQTPIEKNATEKILEIIRNSL